jgi:hypothetical protein
MNRKLSNEFLRNFWVIFLLTILATVLAFVLNIRRERTDFRFACKKPLFRRRDHQRGLQAVDASAVVENGGGVQIVDKDYNVVYSSGVDTIGKDKLSVREFTDFLTESKSKPYHYDILYQPKGEFWLIVTFPSQYGLILNWCITRTRIAGRFDARGRSVCIVALSYLLILALLSLIYSRATAARITVPLKKLCDGTRLLREGDYSARVDLRLKTSLPNCRIPLTKWPPELSARLLCGKKGGGQAALILDIPMT